VATGSGSKSPSPKSLGSSTSKFAIFNISFYKKLDQMTKETQYVYTSAFGQAFLKSSILKMAFAGGSTTGGFTGSTQGTTTGGFGGGGIVKGFAEQAREVQKKK